MPSVGGRSRGHRIRGWPVTAATALTVAAAVISAVPAAAAATVTVQRAGLAAGSPGPGTAAAGTAAAKGSQSERATVRHAAAVSSSAAATGSLSTVLSEVVNGGYTAAGAGLRNLGYGTISITGIPAGATVKSATLLWDILAGQAEPAFAQGTLDGKAVTGTPWASGASPCWPASANFAYEADVTSLVTGNGSYNLAGFATGQSDGADPWTAGSAAPLDEGASLVVVYQLPSMPQVSVQIAEGATETDSGNSATATLNGFTVGATPSATTTYIVADGQMAGNTASFDGNTLPGVGFPGNDPQAVPHYSQGNLWDTVTADVRPYLAPGATSATLAVTGNSDCLVWVGQVLAVSTGTVLGFGDSVAAGYGLGPAEGFPDNPGAYSAVLAQELGYGSQNYAVEGVCAGAGNGCPPNSVDAQIRQAPADLTPSLITLTVGADDIDFAGCLESIIEDGDLSMQSRADPCNPATLSGHLRDFRGKLASDLQMLQGKYPGVPIMVMDYYNPFPPAPHRFQLACPFSTAATLFYEHAQQGWLGAVYEALFQPGQYAFDARTVQGRLYNDAKSILGQLNSAINATAKGAATVVNTNDFAGHDICAHGSEWAFSPTFAIDMSMKAGPVSASSHLSIGGDDVCPDPASPDDTNFRVSEQFKNKFLHVSGSLQIAGGLNCLPHPTVAGQTAIAGDFLQQGA